MDQYSRAMLDGMQSAYGEGFLSPGGAQETRQMIEGLAVEDARVLDLGCGVGGPAALVADELKAREVVGVDVEAEQIARARERITALGLAPRVRFERIEPGRLPFSDERFDIVISKDVVCHMPDKRVCFEEVHRVLAPGGVFVVADWQTGKTTGEQIFAEWHRQLEAAGLRFYFEPVQAYVDTMKDAGFAEVTAADHTRWSRLSAAEQLARALGADREKSLAALGDHGYDARTRITRMRLAGLENGEIEHWHVRGVKAS